MAARLTSYLVVGIVAVTLIAGLIVRAQRDDSDGPVDLIVHNAVVFTGDRSNRAAEAVAVRANQILKVGSNREILRMTRPQTILIDARGASVLPGFNDAHMHLMEGGLSLDGVDLSGVTTIDEAVVRVRAWAETNPDKRWVAGRGWSAFGADVSPTRQALDAAVGDRPVYLVSEDGNTAWVNSRALKLAKIARRTADPDNGRIAKDRKGEPTGVLEGSATRLVASLLPEPSRDDRMRALLTALAEAQRLGITSIQTTADAAEIEMFDAARRDGSVDIRLYSVLEVDDARDDRDVAKLDPVLERYADDPLMKSGAAAVHLDGMDADGLNRLVRLLDARGWQVSIETDTPEETEEARTAFAHAVRSNASPVRDRRHRLEHQDGVFTETGKTKAIGSDWPHGPLSPMRVLQAAVARFALKDALRAYTYGGAVASYDEQRKGTLEPGMLADIVVLSTNIFKLEPSQLDTVNVAYTIFDGRVVYPIDRRATTFP